MSKVKLSLIIVSSITLINSINAARPVISNITPESNGVCSTAQVGVETTDTQYNLKKIRCLASEIVKFIDQHGLKDAQKEVRPTERQ